MKRFIVVIAVILCLLLCAVGCSLLPGKGGSEEILDNYPYEPDTPAPDPHDGLFVSEHGSMRFNGDGESVTIDFDDELAGLLGFDTGEQEATYSFLSGNLPPHGSFPVRYDIAHEMSLTVGDNTVTFDVGLAAEDGSTASVGVDMVKEDQIPFLFQNEDGDFFNVLFLKQN